MAIKPQFYETLYLVRPDINSEDLTIIQNKVTSTITSGEGEIIRDEKWAERDLAYPINDYTRGTYYIVEFKALPNVIAGIEKHLAFHNVDVLRFMTVSIDEPSGKTTDTTTAAAPKKENTPPPSAPAAPSTPQENKPAEAAPSAPTQNTPDPGTPPESASQEDTSSTSSASGFTAAPPLNSENKESGGDK